MMGENIDYAWEKYSQDCPLKVQSGYSTGNFCDGHREECTGCEKEVCAPWHFLSQYIEDQDNETLLERSQTDEDDQRR